MLGPETSLAPTRATGEPLDGNRFGLGVMNADTHAAVARSARADRRRVAHAVTELHVVGGRPVFVDVDALELAVLFEAEVVRARELPNDPEHDQREPADQEHAGGAADELRFELIQTSAVEEALDDVG